MALGGFFGQLGYQAGQNILYGQEQQDRQATIDIKRAEAATMQMSALQKKQQMETQQAIGQAIASDNALNGAKVTDPLQQAQMYDKAAGIATSRGDFATAKQMSDLANNQRQAAGEQAKAVAQQQHQANENLATAADELASNPTPDNLKRLVDATKAAGKNPLDIPPPGTPQFTTWLNQQKKAGMDSKQRAELAEKTVEFQQRQQDRKEEFAQREQDRREQAAFRAQMAAGMAEDRKARLQMERERIDLQKQQFDYKKEFGGGAGGGVQGANTTTAIAGAAAEALRNVKNMQSFDTGTTASPFVNLTDHSVLDAIAKSGSNAGTPQEIQMFQTAGSGLATQVGRIETLGAGRGVNQTQINQLEKQLIPTAGDSNATSAYKLATAADIVATRMRNQPPPREPALRAEWDKTLSTLDAMVKPEDVLKATKDPKAKEQIRNFRGEYSSLLSKVRADVDAHPKEEYRPRSEAESIGTPGQPPIPPAPGGVVNKPPLPSGWSVKVHQ